MLVYQQTEWLGHSLFNLVHPDDVDKLREQLSTTDCQNSSRILDLKSELWQPRLCFSRQTSLL